LPFDGSYRVQGVCFSAKGQRSRGRDGQTRIGAVRHDLTVKHMVTGRMRDHMIAAYRDEWQRTRPHRPVPMTKWMLRYDNEADSDCGLGRRIARGGWKPRGEVVQRVTEPSFGHAAWIIVKRWRSGEEVGVIDVHPDGEADFLDREGIAHPVPEAGVRELFPRLSIAQCDWIDGEIARVRGPGWISARQRRAMSHEKAMRQAEAVKRFAKRGPNPMAQHLPPMEPVTALYRQLGMNGLGHVPGRVVTWREGSPKYKVAFIQGERRPRRAPDKREV
jgi:hypothetical protein